MFQSVLNLLNDNLGLITLFGGLIVVYLYLRQKSDHKRDAASLILQEIRYAEQQIRNAKQGVNVQYSLASKLLPTNSWNDNIHLFIKDLKEMEIDMISGFYAKTTFVDSLISKRTDQKTNPLIVCQNLNSPALSIPSDSVTAQPTGPVTLISPSPAEAATVQILTEVSNSIEFLYNTPTVEKLKKISEKKWYQVF